MSARQRPSRIPTSLQSVFLASNRGAEVHAPPPERVAYKVFFRNWRFQAKAFSETGLFRKNKPASNKGCAAAPTKKDVEVKKPQPAPVKYHPLLKPKVTVQNANAQDQSKAPESAPVISPQAYLDAMLRSRGYNTTRFKSLQTAYYNKPTPLQNASYDLHLVELIRNRDVEGFRAIMTSGISPNPCNSFGESTLHMVCRKGETEFLRVMLDAGASVQVADDYGRSPLTDACWCARPCFDVVRLILEKDPRLFHLTDCRGAVPLSYVPQKDWAAWLGFLESIKDEFWAQRDSKLGEQEPPELTLLGANTRPIPGPPNALTVELAAMVASGKMTPDEAHFLVHDKTECSTNDGSEDEDEDDDSDDDSDDSDDDDSDDSDYDSEDDDDFTLNEDEMADILSTLTLPKH